MYELAGDFTNKYTNYADPNMYRVVQLHPPDSSYVNPFIHYCSHVVTKFNARVIYTYGI